MGDEKKFVPENWDKEVAAVEDVLYKHQEFKVATQEQYDMASDLIKQANTTINIVEAKRKKYTVPLDEMKKAIMDKKNAIVKPLEAFIDTLKAQMTSFYRAEQLRIVEEQKRIDAEALAQAQAEHKSEVVVPVLEVAKTQRTGFSTSTMKKIWKFEVEDITKVPAGYLLPNEVAIRSAIKDGARSIPGLKIYEDVAPNIR